VVELNCSSSLTGETVLWTLIQTGGTKTQTIVDGSGTVGAVYKDRYRFNLSKGSDGEQNIVILNASFGNAGHYNCVDDGGLKTAEMAGQYGSAQLVVIGGVN